MSMTMAGLLLSVGVCAGVAGSLMGAATLVTLTALLTMGVPPVTANVANIMGQIPGGLTGLYGYRAHLPRNQRLLGLLVAAVVAGAAIGGLVLLTVPAAWFGTLIPCVLLAASAFIAIQPLLNSRSRRHQAPAAQVGTSLDEGGASRFAAGREMNAAAHDDHRFSARSADRYSAGKLVAAAAVSGIYGGWLSVSLGTVIMGLVGAVLPAATIHQLNALRLLLSLVSSAAAGTVFVVGGGATAWPIIALIGAGTLLGGWIGARAGQRVHPGLLRVLIVSVGMAAAFWAFIA